MPTDFKLAAQNGRLAPLLLALLSAMLLPAVTAQAEPIGNLRSVTASEPYSRLLDVGIEMKTGGVMAIDTAMHVRSRGALTRWRQLLAMPGSPRVRARSATLPICTDITSKMLERSRRSVASSPW